jgi:CheY-like chemotaxis protein
MPKPAHHPDLPPAGALHVLHLEDNPQDAELIHAVLAREGGSDQFVMAQNKIQFQTALERERFDLILSDYALPDFDGIATLHLNRAKCPETPFILQRPISCPSAPNSGTQL